MELKITSPEFTEGSMIPSKFTCEGEGISPRLSWSPGPKATKSFALISDDPDAPVGTWVHWVIFNIPSNATGLPENVPANETLDDGTMQGINSSNRMGYQGPCPPSGTHRYYFKLYALDTLINLKPGVTKNQLLKAMEGHILAEAQLMGRYKKKK